MKRSWPVAARKLLWRFSVQGKSLGLALSYLTPVQNFWPPPKAAWDPLETPTAPRPGGVGTSETHPASGDLLVGPRRLERRSWGPQIWPQCPRCPLARRSVCVGGGVVPWPNRSTGPDSSLQGGQLGAEGCWLGPILGLLWGPETRRRLYMTRRGEYSQKNLICHIWPLG